MKLHAADGSVSTLRLFIVCAPIVLLSEMATFEVLMVFPAMPEMAGYFDTSRIAWVASVVTLTGAVTLPLVGKAADRYGKKTVTVAISSVFVAGSLLSAVSGSFALMLAGRVLQGPLVGIVSISYSLVRDIVPRDRVPVVLGAVVTGIGMGGLVGPFMAGWLIDGFGFRSIFWFLAGYVVVLTLLYLLVVPESPVRVRTPMDYVGALMLGPALGLILLAVGEGNTWGWMSARTLGVFAAGLAVLAAFALWERRVAAPLIDLRVLAGGPFAPTVLAVGLIAYMMNAHAVMNPTIYQTPPVPGNHYGVGLSAWELAVWTLPMGAVGMLAGPLGGHLARKTGARLILLMGGGMWLLVMFLGAQLFTAQWQVGLTSMFAGFGIGFLHSANANLLQDALPPHLSGVGTSLAGVVSLVCNSASVAVSGSIMAGHIREVRPGSHEVVHADSAFTTAYFCAGVIGLAGMLVAVLMRHGRAPARGGLQQEEGAPARPAAPGPA